MESDTVGDVMHDGKVRALKALALFASVLVYAGMLAYTAVHNYTLMLRGIPADMVIWALVGVAALEVSALALPIALHFWTHAPLQRFAAFAFYLLDMGLLWGNVIVDFALVSGGFNDLPQWAHLYFQFVVPATPLVAGGGWSVIWLLDPASRHLGMLETLRASTREALAGRVANAARHIDIDRMVTSAGAQLARSVVGATLGVSVREGEVPALETPKAATVPSLSAAQLDALLALLPAGRREGEVLVHADGPALPVVSPVSPDGKARKAAPRPNG